MRGQVEKVEPYIPYYIHQFGRIIFKGAGILVQILDRYVLDAPSSDKWNYKLLISQVADEKSVTPEALRHAIKRYVEDGWKQGFSWEWKNIPAGVRTLHPIPVQRLNCSANHFSILSRIMRRWFKRTGHIICETQSKAGMRI